MANTLKFGAGEWATKKGSTLAYNSENGNFKPLPFTFDRSTSATRVNKEGLIEVVSNNEPRIDFLNDSKGALLLEPSRSNLNDYSEDGTQWSVINTTVSLDSSISKPDGVLGAYKQTDDATDAQHRVDVRRTVVNGTEYTFSAFVKKPSGSDINFIYLLFSSTFSTTRFYFNIEEGTSLDDGGTIENYGNGWYRVSATATANSDGNGILGVNLSNASNNNTYSGTGNGAMYVYGIQLEQGSYATSYIPTQGSIGTRVAESCVQTPPSGIIGQTEGTMFCEVSGKSLQENSRYMSISDFNDANKRLTIYQSGGLINVYCSAGGGFNITYNPPAGPLKIAVGYKSGDYVLYVNGVNAATSTEIAVVACSDLGLGVNEYLGTANPPSVGYSQAKLYNTRLSNAELQTLTQV